SEAQLVVGLGEPGTELLVPATGVSQARHFGVGALEGALATATLGVGLDALDGLIGLTQDAGCLLVGPLECLGRLGTDATGVVLGLATDVGGVFGRLLAKVGGVLLGLASALIRRLAGLRRDLLGLVVGGPQDGGHAGTELGDRVDRGRGRERVVAVGVHLVEQGSVLGGDLGEEGVHLITVVATQADEEVPVLD